MTELYPTLNSGGKTCGVGEQVGWQKLHPALHCMLLNRRGWQLALWEPSYASSWAGSPWEVEELVDDT